MKKLLLSAVLLTAAFATKAQDYYPSGNTSNPTWNYNYVVGENDGTYYNTTTGKSGCVIDDAELKFMSFNRGDAYDGAFEIFVNVSDSVYTESGLAVAGGVDTTGTTISLAEQLIDGFYVSKKYYFSPTEPVVRTIYKVRNPSAGVRSTTIGTYANMGSDNATTLDTSSTDGASLSNADRWMVTSDFYGYNAGDPINTWVRFGPGAIASAPKFGQKPEGGSDDYLDSIPVTIPANDYVLIMQLNRLDSNHTAARANVDRFNTNYTLASNGYLVGLSATQLDKIVNWQFTTTTSNPQAICAGASYVINGHTYTNAGTYADTLLSSIGTDSIISTVITINASPVISAQSGNVTECGDVSADFSVTSAGNNTYQWYYNYTPAPGVTSVAINGGGTEINYTTDNMTIQGLISGDYNDYFVFCTITGSNGCSINSANDTIVVHATDSTGISQSICPGDFVAFNGVNYTTAGDHTVTLTNMYGCDSLATLRLTVYSIDLTTTVVNDTVTANQTGAASYQWLDCNNNNAVIAGETSQDFIPTQTGDYSVIVTTTDGCMDTSACANVLVTGAKANSLSNVTLFPNPSNGLFSIKLNTAAQIVITNTLGQVIVNERTIATTQYFNLQNQANGVYFVKVIAADAQKTFKIIKE